MRLFWVVAGAATHSYIYAMHLLRWLASGKPHHLEPPAALGVGHWDGFWDCLWNGEELADALEMLNPMTFSEAMLDNLPLYFLVCAPMCYNLGVLEHERVRWLQQLLQTRLQEEQAAAAVTWLEWYLRTLKAMLFLIVCLVPFNLASPRAHYAVAGLLFGSAAASLSVYLAAPLGPHRAALLAGQREAATESGAGGGLLAIWAWNLENRVRPALRSILILLGAAGLAGIWKVANPMDPRAQLAFGLSETVAILAFHVWLAIFAVDDFVFEPPLGGASALGVTGTNASREAACPASASWSSSSVLSMGRSSKWMSFGRLVTAVPPIAEG